MAQEILYVTMMAAMIATIIYCIVIIRKVGEDIDKVDGNLKADYIESTYLRKRIRKLEEAVSGLISERENSQQEVQDGETAQDM